MRDKNRLYGFYGQLCDIHRENFPDWRFGQFIFNFIEWFRLQTGRDIFYLEDDDGTIQYFREFVTATKGDGVKL